ncbi:MAG: hypothetical protein HRT87_11615 [Legionellales bacterium]|nr:hypothetical protein [Legionellales bacterium]
MYNYIISKSFNLTLYEFKILGLEDQIKTTLNNATYLDSFVGNGVRCNCYALDLFFIELVYNSEFNSITEVKCFKHGDSLDKYSSDLKDLF